MEPLSPWPIEVPKEDVVLALVVPGEPVPFARPRWAGGHSRPYTSVDSRVYKELIVGRILELHARFDPNPLATYGLQALFFRASRRQADLDNFLRGLLDACTIAGVWDDDSQLHELLATVEHDEDPRVQFMVYRCGKEEKEGA